MMFWYAICGLAFADASPEDEAADTAKALLENGTVVGTSATSVAPIIPIQNILTAGLTASVQSLTNTHRATERLLICLERDDCLKFAHVDQTGLPDARVPQDHLVRNIQGPRGVWRKK